MAHLQLGELGAHREVALAIGAAGTVYLCHPFLVHAAQIHRGESPRIMSQPPLAQRSRSSSTARMELIGPSRSQSEMRCKAGDGVLSQPPSLEWVCDRPPAGGDCGVGLASCRLGSERPESARSRRCSSRRDAESVPPLSVKGVAGSDWQRQAAEIG